MDQLEFAVRRLREQLPALTILEHEPMNRHCSFRIGGPVRALVQPASAEEAAAVCRALRAAAVTPLILGNGTNLLVTDAPLSRVAVQFGEQMASRSRASRARRSSLASAGWSLPTASPARSAAGCR